MKFTVFVVLLASFSLLLVSISGQEAAVATDDDVIDLDNVAKTEETVQIPSGQNETDTPIDSDQSTVDVSDKEESTPEESKSSKTEATKTAGADEVPVKPKEASGNETTGETASETAQEASTKEEEPPVQTGPFVDLFGPTLLSLRMIDESHAALQANYTNDALRGKKVVGLYFSADWCGPCRQFTPDLVTFYNKMNARRGKEGEFEIVWISRCRDVDSFGQYFTQMNWLALPPDLALGQHGQMLSQKYKVKGIPTLVLLDEVANVITLDGRNKIPMDKAGVGFPWRNPIATLYMTILPKSLRHMIKAQVDSVKEKVGSVVKGPFRRRAAA